MPDPAEAALNEKIGVLRKSFLQLLTNSEFDFAYFESNGVFLIRVRKQDE
jgi:hypothetical protein